MDVRLSSRGGETKGKQRQKKRKREKQRRLEKKENNCEINVFGGKSEIQYFYRRWILNILGLSLRSGILSFGCNFRDTFV